MSGFSVPPRADLRWILLDLDGTLAEPIWTADNPTSEIGHPIWENVEKALELHDAGYTLCVHTSRPSHDHEAIERWCEVYGLPVQHIFTGKPLGLLYIDDRGVHSSETSWMPIPGPRPVAERHWLTTYFGVGRVDS